MEKSYRYLISFVFCCLRLIKVLISLIWLQWRLFLILMSRGNLGYMVDPYIFIKEFNLTQSFLTFIIFWRLVSLFPWDWVVIVLVKHRISRVLLSFPVVRSILWNIVCLRYWVAFLVESHHHFRRCKIWIFLLMVESLQIFRSNKGGKILTAIMLYGCLCLRNLNLNTAVWLRHSLCGQVVQQVVYWEFNGRGFLVLLEIVHWISDLIVVFFATLFKIISF